MRGDAAVSLGAGSVREPLRETHGLIPDRPMQ
jgi:hypothetical protein